MESDSDLFYRYTGRKAVVKSDIGPLKNNEKIIKVKKDDIAEILADLYEGICTEPYRDLNDKEILNDLFLENDISFRDYYIDLEFIDKTIKALSTKPWSGPDVIPLHCLKFGGSLIVMAVADIASYILDIGYIPSRLKPAWVTPIWKGGDRDKASEYRPISISNYLLKVIERLIRKKGRSCIHKSSQVKSRFCLANIM